MRILLAIDGSPCSKAAIAEVYRRPWPENTEVRVVIADCPLDPAFFKHASPTVFDEIVKQQRAAAVAHLRDAVAILGERAPWLRVIPVLLEGSPKEVIVDEAERWGADLIVLGSHGYGVLKRFLLGSVSLAVATHAPCSVEIVRCAPTASTDTTTNS